MTILDFLITLSIIFGTLNLIYLIHRNHEKFMVWSIAMYIYHLLFIIVFYFISFSRSSDAFNYYHRTLSQLSEHSLSFSMGTKFIDNITYILIDWFSFSYFNTFLLFGTIGFFGILLLGNILLTNYNIPLFMSLFFFLPGLHFWLSSLGKDSLIFFFLVLSLYGLIKNNIFWLSISIFLVFLIRPHIALMLISSIVVYFIIKSKVNIGVRITFSIILLGISIVILQSVMQYIGLESFNLTSINEYIAQRQTYNLEGGSSIDISNMGIVSRFLTFWYRPLFENFNLIYLVISFENLILIFMTFYMIWNRKYIQWNYVASVSIIYIILVSFILSSTIANFGIIIRQKMMILPMFYYLFYTMVYNKKLLQNKHFSKII